MLLSSVLSSTFSLVFWYSVSSTLGNGRCWHNWVMISTSILSTPAGKSTPGTVYGVSQSHTLPEHTVDTNSKREADHTHFTPGGQGPSARVKHGDGMPPHKMVQRDLQVPCLERVECCPVQNPTQSLSRFLQTVGLQHILSTKLDYMCGKSVSRFMANADHCTELWLRAPSANILICSFASSSKHP